MDATQESEVKRIDYDDVLEVGSVPPPVAVEISMAWARGVLSTPEARAALRAAVGQVDTGRPDGWAALLAVAFVVEAAGLAFALSGAAAGLSIVLSLVAVAAAVESWIMRRNGG